MEHRLADLAKGAAADRQKLRDLAAAQGGRDYFELGPMARFMPQPGVIPGQPRQYTLYQVPPDRIAYPTGELLTALLDLRSKDLGATAVVGDMPKDHFYVATLVQRDEPTQEEFRKSYVHSMAKATEYDADLDGISGAMQGMASNVVAQCWAHGEAFEKWRWPNG